MSLGRSPKNVAEKRNVFVEPYFYELTIDQKKSFMNAILTYYYIENNNCTIMYIHDNYSGKEIGTMNKGELKLK